jgi:uncharacterized ferritin-like protein (DUF455 family)
MTSNKYPNSLCEAALNILNTHDAHQKAKKTRTYATLWREGEITDLGQVNDIPDRPARPNKPVLLMPRDMPKRKKAGTDKNKIALLHALSHIELNAIDLAWDIIARFSFYFRSGMPAYDAAPCNKDENHDFDLPLEFYTDWLKVADDEAKHFLMLSDRLADFNAQYGDLPAHDGLWESATKTAEDFAARLAIVPMVLEARGLDVTPNMIKLMIEQGDNKTADMLKIIHDDEITHVAAGTVWFKKWCMYHERDEESYFQELVRQYFNANLKKPFNHPSRIEAGMIPDWYEPLAESM